MAKFAVGRTTVVEGMGITESGAARPNRKPRNSVAGDSLATIVECRQAKVN